MRIRLAGPEAGKGLVGWSLRDVDERRARRAGDDAIRSPAAGERPPHPNGVTALDHVVAITPALDRTVAALQGAGLDLRRIREEPTPAGAPRQAFFRLGATILEVVQEPAEATERAGGDRPAFFWGLAFVAPDLDATVAGLGERVSEIRAGRPARPPHRHPAPLRRPLGPGAPMSADLTATGPERRPRVYDPGDADRRRPLDAPARAAGRPAARGPGRRARRDRDRLGRARADLARAGGRRARGSAGGYRGLGLEPGDRLASLMPNRIDLVVHYLACFKAGLVATPLNYRYTHREIDHALEVSGARALLAHVERAEDVAASELAAGLELGTIAYRDAEPRDGARTARRRGWRTSSRRCSRPSRCRREPPPDPAEPGGDLLHLRQHRPGQGRHPHAASRCAG